MPLRPVCFKSQFLSVSCMPVSTAGRLVGVSASHRSDEELSPNHYIDSTTSDPAEELTKLGGARVILSTVTDGDAVASTIGGLGVNGELIVVGAAEQPIAVPAFALIGSNSSVRGHASGTAADSEDTLAFTQLAGVQARIETVPLEKAADAYDKMIAGDARFRMVLTMESAPRR